MQFLDKSEREHVAPKSKDEVEELHAKIQSLEIQLAVLRSELGRSFRPLSEDKRR